ncbi:hypothetical protein ACFL3Z_02525 [Gemmatimonadota bacterium]
MQKTLRLLPVFFVLFLNAGCRIAPTPSPILYEGNPKPRGEIAIIEVGKERTWFFGGYLTVIIEEITRVGSPSEVVFQKPEEMTWSSPNNFELLPGTYRVEFRYVQVEDARFEIHPTGPFETTLNLRAGYRYLLSRYADLNQGRFVLTTSGRPIGEGGG